MLQLWMITLLLAELALYIWSGNNLRALGFSWSVVIAFIVVVAFLWRASHAFGSFFATSFMRAADQRAIFTPGTLKALVGEFMSRLITFNLSQPFPGLVMPNESVDGKSNAPNVSPILLVHGYFSNRGLWFRFARRLHDANVGRVFTITCGPPLGDINHFAAQLHARIEAICTETNQSQLHIVAHSMGGLITRAYMRDHGHARIRSLTTLGTPHHGTKVSTFGLGRCTRQMRWLPWGNRWLVALFANESQKIDAYPKTLSIYSENDDIVYPPESSRIAWGENIALTGVGHVGLLFDERVAALVVKRLRADSQAGNA
jgi:predicted alpha/beta hydrolase family esterase